MLQLLSIAGLAFASMTRAPAPPPTPTFNPPVPVTIAGYSGDAMEPFLSADGKYLFFNNRNDAGTDTNLYFARRANKTKFKFVGPVGGVNSPALDAVATMDAASNFYFVSTRSYGQTLSTIYRGRFANGAVTGAALVPNVSKQAAPWVNFDVDISRDGTTMYFVDSRFDAGAPVTADLVIAEKGPTGFLRSPTSAQVLATVNTPGGLEYGAAISKDGRTLAFTRAAAPLGASNPAIYVATRASTTSAFGPATRVTTLTGFVEAPTWIRNSRAIYFHQLVGGRFVIYYAPKR